MVKLICVKVFESAMVAEAARALLEGNGIAASFHEFEEPVNQRYHPLPTEKNIKLFISEENASTARELLSEVQ